MRIAITVMLLAGLALSLPSQATQKASSKGSKHSSKKPKTVQKKPEANLNEAPAAEVIPQESSLHADIKKTKKVVIVPAPPPPPGNDPIPPKRNP